MTPAEGVPKLGKVHTPYTRIPGQGAVLLTCEHASQRMPEGWRWPKADQRLLDTHWAFDLGAAELTQELAEWLECGAVLSNFSRLVIDPNRELDSPTLFREHAEGAPIELNFELAMDERNRRIDSLYTPFHDALNEAAAASNAETMFSIHSFTPLYEGTTRTMEIGILFDSHEPAARALAQRLHDAGFITVLNEPWSGKNGLMYSVEQHAVRHGKTAIEIEVRQDLATDPAFRKRLVEVLGRYFV